MRTDTEPFFYTNKHPQEYISVTTNSNFGGSFKSVQIAGAIRNYSRLLSCCITNRTVCTMIFLEAKASLLVFFNLLSDSHSHSVSHSHLLKSIFGL